MISILMQVIDFYTAKEFEPPVSDILVIFIIFNTHFEHTVHVTLVDKAKNSIRDPSEARDNELDRIFTALIEPVGV